jgi:hypothetical protein
MRKCREFKGLSIDTTHDPPLKWLDNTFKGCKKCKYDADFESPTYSQSQKNRQIINGRIFWIFFLVLYSTMLHLPPLRFYCVGGS